MTQALTELTPDQQNVVNMKHLLSRMHNDIARALPKHVGVDRFLRTAVTAMTKTPELGDCTPGSFIGCLLTAAQLGLEPNTPLGQGYLIPRNTKVKENGRERWEKQCTWQTGYQGMIDLAYRSGLVVGIDADVVREGDEFEWEKGLNPDLKHKHSDDANRDDREVTHAWAIVRLRDAEPLFMVMPRSRIEARRKIGQANGFGWKKHYEEMAKKTVLRAALKYAPKSAELVRANMLEDAGTGNVALIDAVDSGVAEAMRRELTPVENPTPNAGALKGAESAHAALEAKAGKGKPKSEAKTKPKAKKGEIVDNETGEVLLTAEQAAQGYELDPNTGEVIPPVGGKA